MERRGEQEEQELDITFRSLMADPVPEPPGPLELGPWLQKLSTEEMVRLMEELVRGLNPPPCCIIGDVYIPWARTVAANCGIQHHYLTTMSAAALALGLSVSDEYTVSPSHPVVSGEISRTIGPNRSECCKL